MTITRRAPNTIWLGGPGTEINDLTAKAAITPGHLVERVNTAGVWQWQKHSLTAAGNYAKTVANNAAMLNSGVDTAYAALDLVEVISAQSGTSLWMLIASGQSISYGQSLESAGDGTLRAIASGTAMFKSLETSGAVIVQTRLRVEAL